MYDCKATTLLWSILGLHCSTRSRPMRGLVIALLFVLCTMLSDMLAVHIILVHVQCLEGKSKVLSMLHGTQRCNGLSTLSSFLVRVNVFKPFPPIHRPIYRKEIIFAKLTSTCHVSIDLPGLLLVANVAPKGHNVCMCIHEYLHPSCSCLPNKTLVWWYHHAPSSWCYWLLHSNRGMLNKQNLRDGVPVFIQTSSTTWLVGPYLPEACVSYVKIIEGLDSRAEGIRVFHRRGLVLRCQQWNCYSFKLAMPFVILRKRIDLIRLLFTVMWGLMRFRSLIRAPTHPRTSEVTPCIPWCAFWW